MKPHFTTIKIAIPALMLLAAVSAHSGTPATLQQLPPIAPGIAALPRLIGNPGDASIERINLALAEDASVLALAAECKETGGAQSEYSHNVTVAMRGPQYLSILASDDWYCGGAHPDGGNTPLVYDLATGAPVDWKKILPTMLFEQSANHDDPAHALVISATLTQLYVKSKTDPECHEALAGGPGLEFALWPDASANGLSIQPQNLPHVIAA